MRVGLIDVDSHNFPNLALMKISAYHKAQGDEVEWWWGWGQYDRVYKSKVFDETYSPDRLDPVNTKEIIKGVQAMVWTTNCRMRSSICIQTTVSTQN